MAVTPTTGFKGVVVTAPSANPSTTGNLADLVQAVDATSPVTFNQLVLTADSGNANSVYVGDVNVSTTRYAFKLAAGISTPVLGGTGGRVDMTGMFVLGGAATQKLAVAGIEAHR
jgi:hypothetical protein